ncbi:single-stranded DNA-binding protein [Streptococcus parasanguinis]|jgi:single-strand DNA-binding protein|uniref:single-stranded DNA-binding protein n=1 Tax=Streptococcus parasanguinis TaxID=1318 RepID=UPI00232EC6C7|nr:single-stranded DNA-binding protein [Streptococcus parasanguinis]MDB8616646.1 single-stranded DNA-binding protein [Streptococcus parasanguinis]
MNNCINLTGRLVEDPEIKKISERARVCNFTLASQRDRKGEDGKYTADFIECVLLNTFADKFVTYARKGDLIQVIGRLETTISKKSEYSRKYYKVHCDKWYLLNSASGSEPQLTEEEEKK